MKINKKLHYAIQHLKICFCITNNVSEGDRIKRKVKKEQIQKKLVFPILDLKTFTLLAFGRLFYFFLPTTKVLRNSVFDAWM